MKNDSSDLIASQAESDKEIMPESTVSLSQKEDPQPEQDDPEIREDLVTASGQVAASGGIGEYENGSDPDAIVSLGQTYSSGNGGGQSLTPLAALSAGTDSDPAISGEGAFAPLGIAPTGGGLFAPYSSRIPFRIHPIHMIRP